MREARAGNKNSLAELLELCRDYLLLIANRELDADLRTKFGASDLVQDTMVRAHERFDHFAGRDEAEFRGWLRSILLNRLLSVRRAYRETGKRSIAQEVSWDQLPQVRNVVESVAACDETPSQRARVNEQERAIATAIGALPDDYREVLVLRYWERLTFAEIGQRMGRSAGAARKLWLRAIDRLEYEGELDRVGR